MTRCIIPPAAVLFDCDGVLADSESLVLRIVAESMQALGVMMTPAQAGEIGRGPSLPDFEACLRRQFGQLPADWVAQQEAAMIAAVAAGLQPVEGALPLVVRLVAAAMPRAVCSNAGRAELLAKLDRLSLRDAFAPRIFSFEDVARAKPHPNIYLAAAAAVGADPGDCVVVEDSLTGARAGIAAGCRVFGLLAGVEAAAFIAIGAEPLPSMAALPARIGLA